MIENQEPISHEPLNPPGINETWKDLLIYLAGGIGIFILCSIPLNYLFQGYSLGSSLVSYGINCLILGGAAWFWAVRRGKTSFAAMGFWPSNWQWKWLVISLLISTLIIPLRGIIGAIFQLLLGGGLESLQMRANLILPGEGNLTLNFIVTLLFAGILIPISEELYFRGLLHRWMIGKAPFFLRIALSALLFAVGHFDSVGVAASSFVHGVVAAYTYEKTRTLWMPISLHILSNSLAIGILYLGAALGINLGLGV